MNILNKIVILIITITAILLSKASANVHGDMLSFQSTTITIGVLLNEIPALERLVLSAYLLEQPLSFWQYRAQKQLKLLQYTLLYGGQYSTQISGTSLPDLSTLTYTFTTLPYFTVINGLEFVARNYTFSATTVGIKGTAAQFSSLLADVGDSIQISFYLPIDPLLLIQRTGLACIDEQYNPLHTYDPERVAFMYDWSCTVEPPFNGTFCNQCHCDNNATMNCVDALEKYSGSNNMILNITLVAWNETLAEHVESQNKYSLSPSAIGADLVGLKDFFNQNFLVYRYYSSNSCEKKECLVGSGWRRLLLFDSVGINIGNNDIFMGQINYINGNETSFYPAGEHNLYYWDPCHNHPHFSAYANYSVTNPPSLGGHKQGFCMGDVFRLINHRNVSLSSKYTTCLYQGITSGWGDDYQAGTPCNWFDMTLLVYNETTNVTLTDYINPKNWLCEGEIQYAKNGSVEWIPTGETTTSPPYPTAGLPIDKYNCTTSPGALNNNVDNITFALPTAGLGLLTSTCIDEGQVFGPLRDCEFELLAQALFCTAGQSVTLYCSVTDILAGPQVLRVCESSIALGHIGTACRYNDPFTLANEIVYPTLKKGEGTAVTFVCPSARDSVEVGGVYSLYGAAVLNGIQPNAPITCSPSK